MSAPKLFQYKAGQMVRTLVVDGEPGFIAVDVCAILSIRNSRDAIARLDDDEKGVASTDTLGGAQEMAYVTESGLYSLVFTSRKQEAKAFKRWVTSEVLPAIRKTGSYSTAPSLSGAELLAHAVLEAQSMIAAKDQQIAVLEPKARYVDVFVTDSDLLSIRTIASTLGVQETWLRQELVSRKWIYAEHASRWSDSKNRKVAVTRYSEYAEKKAYFQRVENHDAPRFRGEVMHTLKATAAGANAIARMVPRWQAGDAA